MASFGWRALSLLALASGLPPGAAAQSLVVRHELSIYGDEKDVGLRRPEGVACNPSTLVVSDTGNARLVKFVLQGRNLSPGLPIRLEQVKWPSRVEILADGTVLVLDQKTRSIVRIDAQGKFAGRVEYRGEAAPKEVVPAAFEVGEEGTLYVLDVISRSVLAVDRTGSVTRTIDLPKARSTVFTDIAVDPAGTVHAIDAVGATLWSAKKGETAFAQVSKTLKDHMNFPVGLSVVRGSLIAVDQNGSGLVALGLDGAFRGRQLAMGWTDGLLQYPAQACVTGSGELFVADRGNSRVQLFTLLK
jgi:DNA-binding beta-propeller fold protein YncE